MTPASADTSRIVSPDVELVEAVRGGDEAAFETLVLTHQTMMTRVAGAYVGDEHAADALVEDTWLVVLTSLDDFDGRHTLQSWIIRMLLEEARAGRSTRDRQPQRTRHEAPSVTRGRFAAPGDGRPGGHWADEPTPWVGLSADGAPAPGVLERLRRTIDLLGPEQRVVLVLRDVEGWSAAEVSETLEISQAAQRWFLHRARSRLRAALEDYVRAGGATAASGVRTS